MRPIKNHLRIIFILGFVIFSNLTISFCFGSENKTLPKEGEELWNLRGDKNKLESCISFYENYIQKDKSNEDACARLSRAYYHLSSYFLGKKR